VAKSPRSLSRTVPGFFPRAHADIDWSRGYETLETELQQVVREAALGPHRADKLVKVWLRDGHFTLAARNSGDNRDRQAGGFLRGLGRGD
jgi:hypothetical protein